jgi:regulatory protein
MPESEMCRPSMSEVGGGEVDAVLDARRWLERHGAGVGDPPSDRPHGGTHEPASRHTGLAAPDGEVEGEGADPEAVARAIVLRKLTVQDRTRAELATVLRNRRVPVDVAEAVLERMAEVGLVDDAAFAQRWVRDRHQRRHLSRAALMRELATKGVSPGDAGAAVAAVDDQDELDAARSLAKKKSAAMSGLDREVRYRRLAGALARRGFSAGVAAKAIAEVMGE